MYPRLPRLLRLALLVLCLTLSLLVVLRAGGGHQGRGSPDLLRQSRQHPELLQGPLLSSILHSTARPKSGQKTPRANRTVATSAVTKTVTTVKAVEAVKAVNPHPFEYLINPRNACRSGQDSHPQLLVYVHSAPTNLKKRMSIRQTWGERGVLQSYKATLVFIMGTVPDSATMDLLQMESERFEDIVQEDFVDSYRNLTYKAIAGLKWAATFCPHATYILKTDDDILVNLPRVIHYIQTVVKPQFSSQRLILCNQWVRMKIIRDVKSKWYVPEKELKGEYFSPYCSGSAFILSGDMAGLLYEASLATPFFWVDDFYITGTLVQRLQIKHRSLNRAYSLNPGLAEGKFRNDTKQELFFFHLHKLLVMYRLWGQMKPANTSLSPTWDPHRLTAPDSVLPVPRAA